MPLNHILRKCKQKKKKFTKFQEKINHFKYMDNIKIFFENVKELDSLVQTIRNFGQDRGMRFENEKCDMILMEKRNNVEKRTAKSGKHQYFKSKRKLQDSGIIRSRYHQASKKWKKEKSTLEEQENFSKPNSAAEISTKK